jgi:hypothetical protein
VGEIAGRYEVVVTEIAHREMAAKWRRFSQAAHSPQRRRRSNSNFVSSRLQSGKAAKGIPHKD